MSDKHLLIFDISGFANRAFFASPAQYREDGLPIWAVIGAMGMIWNTLQRAQLDTPTHGVACFDFPGRNFRHDLFKNYKWRRPQSRREELYPQIPFLKHACKALGLYVFEAPGFEADDSIVSLAHMAAAQGARSTIISSDKDVLQAVRDGVIEVVEPVPREKKQADGTMKWVRQRFQAADVKRKFGVSPDLVPDVQALSGDPVDDFPGLPRIGPKIAGQLIRTFGGLEPLLKAVNQSGMAVGTPAIRKALREGAKDARLYKKLATLDINVPDLPPLENLVLHPPEMGHIKEVLRVLGEARRFNDIFGGNPDTTIRLPHVPAPLVWWHGIPKDGVTVLGEIPRDPQDGYFKTRLVRGGPWVPARVWRSEEKDFVTGKLTGFDIVKCEINGKAKNPLREWLQLARMPITKADFDHRAAVSGWAKTYKPDGTEANPSRAIDWLTEEI